MAQSPHPQPQLVTADDLFFRTIKSESLLPTVAKCMLMGIHLIVGIFSVGSLTYGVIYFAVTVAGVPYK